ncbi:MAG: hydrogenase maturation nickel metallochaperone HypA [Chloroflexia bacterium]
MHELSIMSYLLDAVETKAKEMGASRVRAINLVVGERTGALDDSLLFYFDMLTPQTVVEGAKLNIRRTRMVFRCAECEEDYTPEVGGFDCGRCGVVGQMIYEASELLLESIEVEDGSPDNTDHTEPAGQ